MSSPLQCQHANRSFRPLSVRRRLRSASLLLFLLAAWTTAVRPAVAQEGFGFHGGGTIDPDQGFFGMHFVSNPLTGQLRIYPGADVGFGDDVILAAFHVDFTQWFQINPRWHIYFGGGPAVNIYRFDVGGFGDDTFTEVEGGFDSLIGFAHDSGMMLEMRVGANGSPDLRFSVGFTFK